MFRTADAPLWSKRRIIRLVFCTLIICLAVHFLVEDTLLFTEFASLQQAASSAERADSEEFEHLDDLAMANTAGLPASGIDQNGSAAYAWNTLFIKQAVFSIFKPPKI